jgi:pimeloyl-ACP methyl ester carboxylesterase
VAAFDPARFTPSEVGHADVDGASLGWREFGSGAPLLMITGWTGTMAEWDPALIELLGERHRVIVFDNRGAGTSTGDVAELTHASMAADAVGLLDALGIERADVLGWSMGGCIGEEFGIRHGDRLEKLVLCGADPGGTASVLPSDPEVMRLLEEGADPDLDTMMKMVYPPGHEQDAQEFVQRILLWPELDERSFDVPDEVVKAQGRAGYQLWAGEGKGAADRLGRIGAPTLVASGEKDVLVPVANARFIAEQIPNSTLEVYPDSGHAFLFQVYEQFAADVNEFLA